MAPCGGGLSRDPTILAADYGRRARGGQRNRPAALCVSSTRGCRSACYLFWLRRPRKGLAFAIDAARFAGIALRIGGPIADPIDFRQTIEPRVHAGKRYLGHLPHTQLAQPIGRASVFRCTPMWDEPFGLVVAESLACGTPVAEFARGAIRDLLDSTCGELATPGDAAALGESAVMAQRLNRRACRPRADQEANAETMMEGYEALHHSCVDRHPPPWIATS